LTEQRHLERQQHLPRAAKGIVSQRRFPGLMTKGIERNAKAGFNSSIAESFRVGHAEGIPHAED
jgi:hypothetical protein